MFRLLPTMLVLALSTTLFFFSGCPTTQTSDGGVPDNKVPEGQKETLPETQGSCPEGTQCLTIETEGVRSCSVLLKLPTGASVQSVVFDDLIRGRYRISQEKLGLVFVWKEDKPLEAGTSIVQIRLPAGTSLTQAAMTQATCYDASGNPISKPIINLK